MVAGARRVSDVASPRPAYRLVIQGQEDVSRGVLAGQQLARQVGFDAVGQSRFATAISELAQNVVRYAKRGTLRMRPLRRGRLQGVEAIVEDQGPGIADVEDAMGERISTGGGLGLGLPGTQRMMDEFELTSTVGQGTRVLIRLWLPQ